MNDPYTLDALVALLKEKKKAEKAARKGKKMADVTFAFKIEYSKLTFGDDFSGHDNANFIDRQPTAADDGDNHGTAYELDPLTMSAEKVALMDELCQEVNKQTVKKVGGKWAGIRWSLNPSDGRV